MRGIIDLAGGVVEDREKSGEPVPESVAGKTYSGRFHARIPGHLHRRLAIEAAEAGISLNRLVAYKLAS